MTARKLLLAERLRKLGFSEIHGGERGAMETAVFYEMLGEGFEWYLFLFMGFRTS